MGVARISFRKGNILGVGLVGGSRGATGCWKNFENLQKIFLRRVQICIILAYFPQNFTNIALFYAYLEEKCKLLAYGEKILKILTRIQ